MCCNVIVDISKEFYYTINNQLQKACGLAGKEVVSMIRTNLYGFAVILTACMH